MTPEQNKYLAEAMKLCWHEITDLGGLGFCAKCNTEFRAVHYSDWNPKLFNPNFTTDSGFCLALAYAQDDSRHEWTWKEFLMWAQVIGFNPDWETSRAKCVFTPDNFAPTLVEFMKEVGK